MGCFRIRKVKSVPLAYASLGKADIDADLDEIESNVRFEEENKEYYLHAKTAPDSLPGAVNRYGNYYLYHNG